MTYEFLQQYWWCIVSLLGAILVFLMFVQGGNILVFTAGKSDAERRMMINSTGRKWDLTFTTLVTFGGAFFASFPLFYSTSFGGAYWVWILILLTFVLQAVSYEFQNKKGNIVGSLPYRVFLLINGIFAPLLIGAAIGTFFTGSDFTVNKAAMTVLESPVISRWGNSLHGLEVITSPDIFSLAFGVMILLIVITLGGLYMINNINDDTLRTRLRKQVRVAGLAFVVFFLLVLYMMFTMEGFAEAEDGTIYMQKYVYLTNFLELPIVLATFLIGVVLVLVGYFLGAFTKKTSGIWFAGIGIVLAAWAILLSVGLNGVFYPSYADLQSSLTIHNSSSSYITLKAMFFVSFFVPFVIAYIVYAWRAMDSKKITKQEISETKDKY